MRNIIIIFAVLCVIALSGCAQTGIGRDNTACTADAKLCPDGSAVGRTGPNCEFEACPITTGDNDTQLIGGDKDEGGCLIGAGYSWCEAKQKCLRVWEEPCDEGSNAANVHICTEQESLAEICTIDYNPVCGKLLLNTGDISYQTFSNGCGACAAMKVVSYVPGECSEEKSCTCPEGYRKDGEACNPECYYSEPACMMPSVICE